MDKQKLKRVRCPSSTQILSLPFSSFESANKGTGIYKLATFRVQGVTWCISRINGIVSISYRRVVSKQTVKVLVKTKATVT